MSDELDEIDPELARLLEPDQHGPDLMGITFESFMKASSSKVLTMCIRMGTQ